MAKATAKKDANHNNNKELSKGYVFLVLVVGTLLSIYPTYKLTQRFALPVEEAATKVTARATIPTNAGIADQIVRKRAKESALTTSSGTGTVATTTAAAAAAAATTTVAPTASPMTTNTNTNNQMNWDNLDDDMMQTAVCANLTSSTTTAYEWEQLCDGRLVPALNQALRTHDIAHIVQIGAHIGFEQNDPLARGMMAYLDFLTPEQRQHVHWTFVEPSPPNFKRLQQNLQQPSKQALCRIHLINAAVMSDDTTDQELEDLTFYSISETIDPETGYDSKSHQSFPIWITQISGFRMDPITFNRGVWRRKGLNMADYVVHTKVTTKRYSDLMHDIVLLSNQTTRHDDDNPKPVLVLIDTEGFDCDIVLGIAHDSPYWSSHSLVFEQHQCQPRTKNQQAFDALTARGYHVYPVPKGGQNAVAVRRPTRRFLLKSE